MQLRVQFFSQLRALMGAAELEVQIDENSTVRDLLAKLYEQRPALRPMDQSILVGAGVEFVDRDYRLQPGDEISIMPPVQGG